MASTDRGPQVIAVTSVFLVLGTVFSIMRFWVRLKIQKAFHIDDWLIAAALIFFYANSGLQFAFVHEGLGKHIFDVPFENIVPCLRLWWISLLVGVQTVFFLRLSICALVLRVVPGYSLSYAKTIKGSLYGIVIFNILLCISFCLMVILSCTPPSYFWTRLQGAQGSCIDGRPSFKAGLKAFTALAGVEDLAVALIPIAIVSQLNIHLTAKLMAYCLLVMGCIAGIANWIRYQYLETFGDNIDFLYNAAPLCNWSTTETGLGLIAANAATLRPLLQQMQLTVPWGKKPQGFEQDVPRFKAVGQKHDPMKLETILSTHEGLSTEATASV